MVFFMELNDGYRQLIENIKSILKSQGKSQKWLNIKLFGLSEDGKRGKNDLFRKDQNIRNYRAFLWFDFAHHK